MVKKFFNKIMTASLFLAGLSACQTIAPETSMPAGVAVPPPSAYVAMCSKTPADCVLPFNEKTEKVITSLHNSVQNLIIPTEEQGDLWQTVSVRSAGDCEDFALTLRKYLRETLPEFGGAFLIATAFTEIDQYHAVLTIETSSGTLVCDIRFPQCAPWNSFPYEWHLREVAGQHNWENIGDHQVIAGLMSASLKQKR